MVTFCQRKAKLEEKSWYSIHLWNRLNCHNWWVFMAFVRRKIPHIVMSHLFLHSMHSPTFLYDSDFFFFYCWESGSLWAKPWTITFSSELVKVRERITKILNYIISLISLTMSWKNLYKSSKSCTPFKIRQWTLTEQFKNKG